VIPGGRRIRSVGIALGLALAIVPAGLAPIGGWASNAASDGPGALSHFDLARKDCLGTARNTSSKVWFTVANGVLSDVYYPTADNTNVETLQLVVTDGHTFTDLQTRDMTYTVQAPDPRALDCRVVSTAKSGRYRVTTDYLTDPGRNTVLMRIKFEAQQGDDGDYHVYLRYDPTINGNGGGGFGNGGGDSGLIDTSTGHALPVAFDTRTTSEAVNRTYAVPVFSALAATRPFSQVSNGFVGAASDGLVQLDSSHALTTTYDSAGNGNLVQTAQLDFAEEGEVTVALGFGTTQGEAVAAAAGSLRTGFDVLRETFRAGWHAYDASLIKPPAQSAGVTRRKWRQLVDAYYLSANVVKASEDKSFPGAIVASLASPWGQAVSAGDPNNLYFGSYREVFARDLYEAWTALMVDGDLQTARDAASFLLDRQQLADGSMPRNSLLNGKVAPDSFNTQLDEVAYPIVMAYQLGMTDSALYQNHIRAAIDFLIAHGPSFGPERWEEQGGFSPSTIAAEVAGLVAGATIADGNGDITTANVARAVADDWQRSLPGWAVTTNGPLATHPYYIRLSKTGDPNAAISYNVGNGGPTLDQRSVIDQGFLEMVRLGLTPALDPTIAQSLPVVDASIKSDTSSGAGFHRYNGDGYGDGTDGHPWAPSGRGTGHLWPALAGERGEYELATGNAAAGWQRLIAILGGASGPGLIPEQVWELPDLAASPFGTDPTVASIGFRNGGPAGSASPLTWSDAQYIRLMRDLSAGKVLEQPAAVANRYVAHQQSQTSLTVTQPADNSAVAASPVTVAGTSSPGNTIYVAATNTDNNSQTTTATTAVQPDGSFSLSVQVSGGTTVLNLVAVSPSGATAHVQRSIVFDFTPGAVLLDVTDPSGDDNGPGNYAYPTAGDFHAGAFDIQEFRVIESPDGATTTFKLKVRDLSPTFGSPLGAQLVDVYLHDPAAPAANTSTAASFPQRNYVIAPPAAWSRLVEVQGFGQRYIDAHGATVGTVNISANAISRFITFSVPTASLGGVPGTGWGFTVVLTGQDGFSSDQARSFAPTPQSYQFGVCATASGDAHCTFDPNRVPKAMDVVTPAGVVQSDELDYTLHNPVTLQDVTIP